MSTASDVIAGHDLRGRNVIVTGGTAGIGMETARVLAGVGARVVITGRDPDKGTVAEARLRELTTNPAIVFERLDLGLLSDVTRFVRSFLANERPLHLLINSAGTFSDTLRRTPDGFEFQFGVNHLGHFALTLGLLPALRSAGSARVVTVTSRAHRYSDIDFADPNFARRGYEKWLAYGQSKTANALFAVGVTKLGGVMANAVMPGMAMTGITRLLSRAELTARGWSGSADDRTAPAGWKTVPQASATSVWAAVAPELEEVGGQYLEDCAVASPWHGDAERLPAGHHRPFALDPVAAERLWALSTQLVSGVGGGGLLGEYG
jgi:NAD(P)-dependent dehydrogenase (short-subunit alcohol dehydrogenase family)